MKYKIKSKVWVWSSASGSAGAWHFVSVPPEVSEKISKKFHEFKKGWGSLPVKITIKDQASAKPTPDNKKKTHVVFETSIFPNKKDKMYMTYLLPLKKSVRAQAGLQDGDVVDFVLEVRQ